MSKCEACGDDDVLALGLCETCLEDWQEEQEMDEARQQEMTIDAQRREEGW